MKQLVFLAISLLLCFTVMVLITMTKKHVRKLSDNLKTSLPVKSRYFPNAFQSISVYDTASLPFINYAFSTITVRRLPDPLYFVTSMNTSLLIVNLVLSHKSPCFYIHKGSVPLVHPGKQLSKPYLLNKSSYKVLGYVTEDIYNFCQKHEIEYMYSSYLPASFNQRDPQSSLVELKIKLDKVKEDLLEDIFSIFASLPFEPDNKYQRIIKEFALLRNQDKKRENLGFFDRLAEEMKAKRN